jgi:hypothetical protein
MKLRKLKCPQCQTRLHRWRLVVKYCTACPKCSTQLAPPWLERSRSMPVGMAIVMAVEFLAGPSRILHWPQLGIFMLAALILSRVELLFLSSLEVFDPATRLSEMKEQYARMKRLSQRTRKYRLIGILGVALSFGTILIAGKYLPNWLAMTVGVFAMISCVASLALIVDLLLKLLFPTRCQDKTDTAFGGNLD